MAEDFFSPPPEQDVAGDTCAACREMIGELSDAAGWLAGGGLPTEDFRRTVAALEARKLARFGFVLSSAVSPGGLVHFSLRFAENGELCASMDVDVVTGEITVQSACG